MEYATLTISIAALLLSIGTFWFQFIYRADQVICLVATVEAESVSGFCRLRVHLAISNSGDRSLLLSV